MASMMLDSDKAGTVQSAVDKAVKMVWQGGSIVDIAKAIDDANRFLKLFANGYGIARLSLEVYDGKPLLTLRAPCKRSVPVWTVFAAVDVAYYGETLVKHRYGITQTNIEVK